MPSQTSFAKATKYPRYCGGESEDLSRTTVKMIEDAEEKPEDVYDELNVASEANKSENVSICADPATRL